MSVVPFRRPQAPPAKAPYRLVPLTRALLDLALSLERDGVMAEMASGDAFASRAMANPDLSVAVLHGGYLVGCGGLVLHWLGRAEAWALVSENVDKRELATAVGMARRWLDYRQRNPIFRRIECYVRSGALWRASFMRGVGFEPEGRLRGWGPDGADFDVYARVREYD